MNTKSDTGVHLSHCYQGEYENSCKYGDDDCPAKPPPSVDVTFSVQLWDGSMPQEVTINIRRRPGETLNDIETRALTLLNNVVFIHKRSEEIN